MPRFFTLTALALPLVACGSDTRDIVPLAEPSPAAVEAPSDPVPIGADSDDQSAPPADPPAPVCDGYAPAPEGTPACSFDAVCDVDADCAAHAGTYCKADLCASAGCLRGGCLLTKVQGQACARDGECVSGKCACDGEQCVCGPEDPDGAFVFP